MKSGYQPIDKAALGIKELSPETKARMWTNRERKKMRRDMPLFADHIHIQERTAEEVIERDRLYREHLQKRLQEMEESSRFHAAVTLRALRMSPVPRQILLNWYGWWKSSGPCQSNYSAAYCADFWDRRFREAFGNTAFRALLEAQNITWVSYEPEELDRCELRPWRPGDAA